jgi:medium-chain acyl-[acyl-carrier-protein] hydrolase
LNDSALWFPNRSKSPEGAVTLVCFSYAGAGASVYADWQKDMPPSVSVCPVQLAGREQRCAEPPLTSIRRMADEIAPRLAGFVSVPYAFFGYSMGALLSYETALRLRSRNFPAPVGMIVAAHQAPQLPLTRKRISGLNDAEFLSEVRAMGGTREEVFSHLELLEYILRTLRADFTACDGYIHEKHEPLNLPLAVFGGWKDPFVPRSALVPWREMVNLPSRLQMFPGGHFFIHENRALVLQAVAARIGQWLQGGSTRLSGIERP